MCAPVALQPQPFRNRPSSEWERLMPSSALHCRGEGRARRGIAVSDAYRDLTQYLENLERDQRSTQQVGSWLSINLDAHKLTSAKKFSTFVDNLWLSQWKQSSH